MFTRLSPEAQEAMIHAREHSARLRHPWLGTEHLLLGLLSLPPDTRATRALSGLGVTRASVEHELKAELGEASGEQPLGHRDEEALRTLGIDLQEVRRRAESVFGPGALEQARAGRCGLPMMPRLKNSLERASHAARGGMIDSDHLLVGMTEVRGALAMSLLERLGVSADAVRAVVEAQRRRIS
jgi:ATP-dependent Clp protease ATP-binding subunit ClpA